MHYGHSRSNNVKVARYKNDMGACLCLYLGLEFAGQRQAEGVLVYQTG